MIPAVNGWSRFMSRLRLRVLQSTQFLDFPGVKLPKKARRALRMMEAIPFGGGH
jgi:hypothetical protein